MELSTQQSWALCERISSLELAVGNYHLVDAFQRFVLLLSPLNITGIGAPKDRDTVFMESKKADVIGAESRMVIASVGGCRGRCSVRSVSPQTRVLAGQGDCRWQ